MSSSELKPANTKLKSKKKHQLTDQSKAYNFTHQNPQKNTKRTTQNSRDKIIITSTPIKINPITGSQPLHLF
jgi:hypothetical protein